MARLASQAKMEYYPTPEKEILKALDLIKIKPKTRVCALDPCAGDGRTLKIIKEKLNADVYGIELDAERSKQTAEITGDENCLQQTDALVDARITAQAFNLVFNNPPYDWERGYGDKRLELSFIERYASQLVEGGIMILVISKSLFQSYWRSIDLLKVILKNHAIISAVEMTEDKQFSQWILILRKAKVLPLSKIVLRLNDDKDFDATVNFALDEYDYLMFWNAAISFSESLRPNLDHKSFALTAEPKPLKVFDSLAITEEMLENASANNNKIISMALEAIKPKDTIETLLPLRNSHLPLLLPTGHLNGRIEGTNLVINGQVERYVEVYEDTETKIDKNTGKEKEVDVSKEINKFRAKLSVLDLRTKEVIQIN